MVKGSKMSTDALFELLIFLVFLGALLPQIMSNIFGMNTDGWDSGTIALWGITGLVVIAGIVLGIKKNSVG